MRCLYRTNARTAILNEGTRHVLTDTATGNVLERRAIENLEYAIFPANRLRQKQPLERLIRVNERHSKRVGYVLLGEWKLDARILDQACLLGTQKEMQKQKCGPLKRGASTETNEMLVNELFFARGEPSDVERQRWQAAVKIPEF